MRNGPKSINAESVMLAVSKCEHTKPLNHVPGSGAWKARHHTHESFTVCCCKYIHTYIQCT